VDPKDGNFIKTDDLYQKAYQETDDDVQANRGLVNQAKHLDNVRKAGKEMDLLIDRVRSIVNAMNEGVIESKLVESLIIMERVQRSTTDNLRFIRRIEEEKLLKILQGIK
jgi:hypothetical protein